MKDEKKTKQQLISELTELRQQIAESGLPKDETKLAEEIYRQLVEDMNDGYLMVQDGVIIYSNKRFADIYGYDVEEVVGKNLVDFSVSENYHVALKIYKEVMNGGIEFSKGREGVGMRKDGALVITESTSKILQYRDKPTLCIVVRDVTERKLTEKKYKQLLEDMSDGYLMVQEGSIIFSNKRFAEIFGYTPEEVIGRDLVDFSLPETHQEAVKRYEGVMQGKVDTDKRRETVGLRKNGTIIKIESTSNIIQYEGKPTLCIVVRDTSDRKKVEEKYKQLLEDMNDGYVVIQDGKYVFANWKYADIFGFKLEQLLGRSIGQALAFDKYQEKMVLYSKMMDGEESLMQRFDVEALKEDGTKIFIDVNIKPVEYEGNPAFSVIVRDITERKQAEKEIRESEERFFTVFHQNPTAMSISTSSEGLVVDANDSFLRMFEFSREEVIGKTSVDLNIFKGKNERNELVREGLNETKSDVREMEFTTRSGKNITVMSKAKEVIIDGRPHVISMAMDITKLKLTEDKYKQLLDDISDGYAVIQDGKYVFVNQKYNEIFGYEPGEAIGLPLGYSLIPDQRQEITNEYDDVMRQIQAPVERYESRANLRDGRELIIEGNINFTHYEGKPAIGVIIRDITEQRRAEEELREIESRFYSAFHQNPIAMVITSSQDGLVVDANDSFLRMFEYTREEVIGHTSVEINIFNEKAVRDQIVEQCLSKASHIGTEMALTTKTGKPIAVMTWAKEVALNGRPHVISMTMDITEQKLTEDKYRQLLEDMSDGYVVIQDGKYVFANRKFAEIFGYKQEEVLGKPFGQLLIPADRLAAMEQYERVMGKEELPPALHESVMLGKYGTPIIIESNMRLIQYEGKPAACVLVRDITGRRHAEEKYRQLLEDMNDGYLVIQDDKYVFANRKFCEMFRCEQGQVTGKQLAYFVKPDDHRAVLGLYEKIIGDKLAIPIQYEGLALRNDGTTFLAEAVIKNIQYEGKPAIAAVIRDITESKKIENKLKESEKRFRELSDMLPQLVFETDVTGRLTFINQHGLENIGFTSDDLAKGMSVLDRVISEDRERVRQNIAKRIKGDDIGISEYTAVRKDGSTYPFMLYASPIILDDQPVGLRGLVVDITERKQMEEILRESEEKYRNLVEMASDGVCIVQDGLLKYVNSRQVEMWGGDAEELINTPFIDYIDPEYRSLVGERYKKRMDGEQVPSMYEITLMRKDKSKIYVELNVGLINYLGRTAELVICRDVTGRKQVEHALQEERDKAQRYLDIAGVILLAIDVEGTVTLINRKGCEVLGYKEKEIIGKNWADSFLPKRLVNQLKEISLKLLAGEIELNGYYEIPVLTKGGEERIIAWHHTLLKDDKGDIVGHLSSGEDITERKQAENILRESEEKLRLIFESVPEGIILSDLDGKILDINDGAIRMHGYETKEEIIGRNCMDIIVDRERASIMRIVKTKMKKGGTGVVQHNFIKKDGSEFPAAASSVLLRDVEGRPKGFVIIYADITEQRKLQEKLMLADRLASIGQLSAGIAHELNNPLAGVVGVSRLLMDKDVPEDIKADLEIIDKEAVRAANVVKGLLTFARGKGTEKIPTNINSVIQEALQLRSYEQTVRNIKVETEFAADLPQIIVNGTQMQHVFMNLIVNAEQAVLEVRKQGRLKVKTERAGDNIKISIEDDGPGISPKNMKKLFNPFFTTKEVGKGTGLGLSICHGIVTEHGGKIYAESKLGEGARFTIELPIDTGGGGSDGKP